MLTNNKKGFVKGIALIMAMLMVLSVCLTGCGNKAAEETANKAQTEAAAAKSLAEEVKASLAEYLKKTDPVTAEVINAQIDAALAKFDLSDYATVEALTAELTKYAKSEELKALQESLTKYYTQDQVKDLLKPLAEKADAETVKTLSDKLTTALGKISTMESADATLNNEITAIKDEIKSFATSENIDTINEWLEQLDDAVATLSGDCRAYGDEIRKLNQKFAEYVTSAAMDEYKNATDARLNKLEALMRAIIEGLFTQEDLDKIANMKGDFDLINTPTVLLTQAVMSLKQWNDATPEVIKAIAALKDLLAELFSDKDGNIITNDNGTQERLNAYLKSEKTAINNCFKKIGVEIYLANGNLNEYAKVEEALNIYILRAPSIAALKELTDMIANAKAVPHFATKQLDLYNQLLNDDILGCTHKKGTAAFRVVTVADIAAWNKWNDDFDNLICDYLADGAYKGTRYEASYGALTAQYIYQNPDNAANLVVTDKPEADGYKPATKAWTYVDDTILTEAAVGDAYLASYKNTDGIVNFIDVDSFVPSTKTVADLTQDVVLDDKTHGTSTDIGLTLDLPTAKVGEAVAAGTKPTAANQEKAINYFSTLYFGLYNQFTTDSANGGCVAVVNDANAIFAKFLNDSVKGFGKVGEPPVALSTIAAPTDAQYLEALEDFMVEYIADANAGIDETTGTFLYTTVQPLMEKAIARNTHDADWKNQANHSDAIKGATYGIDKYELYYDMMEKAWDLMFKRYQAYATAMLDTIARDYQSVVDYFVQGNKLDVVFDGTTAHTVAAWATGYNTTGLSDGFVNEIINGDLVTGAFTGWKSPSANLKVDKDFNDWSLYDYHTNNTFAADSATTKVTATVDTTIANGGDTFRLMIVAATHWDREQLTALTPEGADKSKDLDEFFTDIIEDAIAHIEEMFDRELFDDYKKYATNDLAAYATETATFYCLNTNSAPLIEAMEHFLTGFKADGTAPAAGVTTNKLFPEEEILINGSLAALLAKTEYVEDKFEETVENSGIGAHKAPLLNAGAAMATVDEIRANYKEILDNVAIKYNYVDYLKVAEDNLFLAYYAFRAVTGVAAEQADLFTTRTGENDKIAFERLQKETLELMKHKEKYTSLLKMICGTAQGAHVEKLVGKTFDAYQDETVRSHSVVSPVLTGTNKVTQLTSYDYAGSACTAFDKIINANAQYGVAPNLNDLY